MRVLLFAALAVGLLIVPATAKHKRHHKQQAPVVKQLPLQDVFTNQPDVG